MSKKKVYLAGPMSNLPYFNFPAFFSYAKLLEDEGYEVFNPAQADIDRWGEGIANCPNGTHDEAETACGRAITYKECMKEDLNYILDNADIIALMPGWDKSKGAIVEKSLADLLKLEVRYL